NNAGAVDDCSSYIAWRGRSEEAALDDLSAPVVVAASCTPSMQAGVIAPASAVGETFGRFG
ncbi:MAG: hypothetical protein Q8R95_12680, partial [Azonexus sp.]|nr:hypothetical protein [Azonexus sp.]